jgi:hypothetical protein
MRFKHAQKWIALLTKSADMDVQGIAYPEFSDADRVAIVAP